MPVTLDFTPMVNAIPVGTIVAALMTAAGVLILLPSARTGIKAIWGMLRGA